MSPVVHARKIIAHELRRLATEIEAGAVSDAIFNGADDLVDAFRREPEAEVCDCCSAPRGTCDCAIRAVDDDGNYYEAGRVGCLTHGKAVD